MDATIEKKMGRPKTRKEHGKVLRMSVDVDASEERKLRMAAALIGETLTSFASNAAMERAERLLAENHISL